MHDFKRKPGVLNHKGGLGELGRAAQKKPEEEEDYVDIHGAPIKPFNPPFQNKDAFVSSIKSRLREKVSNFLNVKKFARTKTKSSSSNLKTRNSLGNTLKELPYSIDDKLNVTKFVSELKESDNVLPRTEKKHWVNHVNDALELDGKTNKNKTDPKILAEQLNIIKDTYIEDTQNRNSIWNFLRKFFPDKILKTNRNINELGDKIVAQLKSNSINDATKNEELTTVIKTLKRSSNKVLRDLGSKIARQL